MKGEKISGEIRRNIINILPLKFIYNKKFFVQRYLKREKLLDQKNTAEVICSIFKPKSVVDFGCATGGCLLFFSVLGVDKIKGIEGSSEAVKLALVNDIEHHDLRKKIDLDRKYDVCICFEVAEHIDEKYEDTFLNNLWSSSDTILFSAAPPGQGGRGHVNCKPYEYWIKKFRNRGYEYEKEISEELKEKLRNNNLMIFSKH